MLSNSKIRLDWPVRTRPDKVSGLCPVGCGPVGSSRARVVAFSYNLAERHHAKVGREL